MDGQPAMNTGVMIKVTIALLWSIIIMAAFGVGRSYDLVVQGWPGLTAILSIMIGGKTIERWKELHVGATTTTATVTSTSVEKDDEK